MRAIIRFIGEARLLYQHSRIPSLHPQYSRERRQILRRLNSDRHGKSKFYSIASCMFTACFLGCSAKILQYIERKPNIKPIRYRLPYYRVNLSEICIPNTQTREAWKRLYRLHSSPWTPYFPFATIVPTLSTNSMPV